jgi:hypothetical protein
VSIAIPLESESVRCADFAAANQIDPGGTGLAPDVIVLVEVPEPWPKPAGKHPDMVDLVTASLHHHEQVRLLAAVPADAQAPRVIAFRPAAVGMHRSERLLGEDPVADLHAVLAGESATEVRHGDPQTLLVCTQGSHDVCCGEAGNSFADAVEQDHPNLEVVRVSHTGGHRFAPTAMSLPDGRMWAFLDAETVSGVLDRSLPSQQAASMCRGWWGAPTGPAQVAERAVFAEMGWELNDRARTVVVQEAEGAHRVTVTVEGGSVFEVDVAVGREVPTIACEAPGGQPVKPGREWQAQLR